MGVFSFKLSYSKGHIQALDGLRGAAVLLVVLHHCFGFLIFPLDKIFYLGWTGVDLFFVLSGFLITGILLDTKTKPGFYKNFVTRRTLRIFPLYYLTLAVFFIVIAKNGEYPYLSKNQIYFWTYTQNLLFSFEGWPPNYILNHFWSLAIEEQFYLLWPFLVWFLSSKNLVKVSFLGILVSILIRNIEPGAPFSYMFTFARFDTLLIGGLIAISIREYRHILERVTPIILLTSTIGILVVLALAKSVSINAPITVRIGYTLIAVFFGAILTASFDNGRIGSLLRIVLESSLLRILGKYSYGIYVYHWIIYNLYYDKLLLATGNPWISTAIFLILTFSIAVLSYHLWEANFIKLKKYFQ